MGKIRLCHYIRRGKVSSRKFSSPSQNFVTFSQRSFPRKGNPYFTVPLNFCLILLIRPPRTKNAGYISAETPTTSSKMEFFVTIGFTVSGCNIDRARKFDV